MIGWIFGVIFGHLVSQELTKKGVVNFRKTPEFGTKIDKSGIRGKEYKRKHGWVDKEVGTDKGKRRMW